MEAAGAAALTIRSSRTAPRHAPILPRLLFLRLRPLRLGNLPQHAGEVGFQALPQGFVRGHHSPSFTMRTRWPSESGAPSAAISHAPFASLHSTTASGASCIASHARHRAARVAGGTCGDQRPFSASTSSKSASTSCRSTIAGLHPAAVNAVLTPPIPTQGGARILQVRIRVAGAVNLPVAGLDGLLDRLDKPSQSVTWISHPSPPGRGLAGHRGQSGDTPLDPGSTIRRNVWGLRSSAAPPPSARLGLRLFSAQSVPSKLFWQHQLRSLAPVPPPPAASRFRPVASLCGGRRWRGRCPAPARR